MRTLLIFVLFGCFLTLTCSRPQPAEENDESNKEKTEYDSAYGAVEDDSLRNNDNTNEENEFSDYNPDEKRKIRDHKFDDNVTFENSKKYKSVSKNHQSNRYIENNDSGFEEETAKEIVNSDIDNNNSKMQNEDGELLFDNSREQSNKIDKNDNEASDSKEQSRSLKQYYNIIREENKIIDEEDAQNKFSRNRRQALSNYNMKEDISFMSSTTSKEEDSNIAKNASEELAIKRHIKKLSSQELEELLNSLSDDKRSLLKKIIDSDIIDNSDNINKREITKKAGAIEENYLENGDSNKIEGGNTVIEAESSLSQNTETTETNKHSETQTENSDLKNTKSAETINTDNKYDSSRNAKLVSNADEIFQAKSSTILPSSISKNEENLISKTDNKREANFYDLTSSDVSVGDINISENNPVQKGDNQGCFCSEDEDLSQLLDNESQSHSDRKREAFFNQYADISDSVKSLEESFPNQKVCDESGSYYRSDMAPLIRVKRKSPEVILKKRAVAFSSDAKEAYCPYRTENENEDNEEGNELNDDGFYDHMSNLEKSNEDEGDSLKDDKKLNYPNDFEMHSRQSKSVSNFNPQSDVTGHSKLAKNGDTDTMSLGSDTDNVLTGVEGVDDNLMFSNLRNTRTAVHEDISYRGLRSPEDDIKDDERVRSTGNKIDNAVSENLINEPNYQENEAFGPLPRNYEGELNRYKRIRRVKQLNSEEASARF